MVRIFKRSLLCIGIFGVTDLCNALTLDITSSSSIKESAASVAKGLLNYYSGDKPGDVPGNLPQPYYWWEAGAMFMHLVDYWYYTGDTTYNAATVQAISFQAGKSDNSFMPANQTTTEGNDDQIFWAFSAMGAAELNFPAPEDGYPSWLAMAQSVFNQQALRWDADDCGGGLRWQINPTNAGYNYKNTVANGGFFQLASRLARFTGNQTYVDWAEKEWDWFSQSVLFDNATFQVNDGSQINTAANTCPDADHTQWSYNYGIFLVGLAYLSNYTEDTKWLEPINGILNHTIAEFFPAGDKVMVESACEPYGTCDTNGFTFKSFVMRWLALTAQLVPSTAATIWPYLQASGVGAASQCDGGTDGITCGYRWNSTTWDGTYGVGQQMSALAAIQANLITVDNLQAPLTANTGGTSKGDPSAGSGTGDVNSGESAVYTRVISMKDKAGAGILTALLLILTLGGGWFLVS
ncbi:hypothetical protein LTR15_000462 [Elasticomyces elasticus]|nr:hypothetical protein LTR15_000462 [Elasticomyces elasticus]